MPPDQDNQEDKKSQKSKIDLPDVIIYGAEKSTRISGKKLDVKKVDIHLRDRKIEYQPQLHSKISNNNKLSYAENNKTIRYENILSASYGTFNTPAIGLIRSQEFNRFDYGIKGFFRASDGEYVNNNSTTANGQFHVGIEYNPKYQFQIEGDLNHAKYGVYGSSVDQLERKVINYRGGIISQLKPSANSNIYIGLSYQQLSSEDEADTVNFNNTFEEEFYKINTKFSQSFSSKIKFSIQADYWNNTYVSLDSTWYNFNILSQFLILFTPNFSMKPGVAYEKISNYHERVSPDLELVLTLHKSLGIAARVNRYYKPMNYFNIWNRNRYVQAGATAKPEDVKANFEVKIEFKPGNNLTVNSIISKQWINDFLYWQRDPDGLFFLNHLNEIELSKFSIGFEYKLLEYLAINSEFTYFIDEMVSQDSASIDNSIPYIEDFRLPVNLKIALPKEFNFEIQLLWIGSRKIDLVSDDKLDDFISFSIHGDKKLNSYLNVFLKVQNALNNRYDIWQGYQELSTQFAIGLNCKW